KIALISPRLIAECHVLHRLCMPRHPPNALLKRLISKPAATHRGKTPARATDLTQLSTRVFRSKKHATPSPPHQKTSTRTSPSQRPSRLPLHNAKQPATLHPEGGETFFFPRDDAPGRAGRWWSRPGSNRDRRSVASANSLLRY